MCLRTDVLRHTGVAVYFEALNSYLLLFPLTSASTLAWVCDFMEIQGWLFDLYPLQTSMILWIKDEKGSLHRFEDPFRPRFYAQGKRSDLLSLLRITSERSEDDGIPVDPKARSSGAGTKWK